MLCFDHTAAHLFREDAALAETRKASTTRPWPHVFMSFEALRERCARHGLSLLPDYEVRATLPTRAASARDAHPDSARQGLVLRIMRRADVSRAQRALAVGHNVLALLPNELLSRTPEDGEALEDAAHAARQLLGASIARRISSKPTAGDAAPWWEEITTDAPGRLLCSIDALLSDAFALEVCHATPAHDDALEALVTRLASYKTPCLRFDMSACASSWPRLTPIQLIGHLHNHGPALERLLLHVQPHEGIELASTAQRYIERLDGGQQHTLTIAALPHGHDDVQAPLRLRADSQSTTPWTPVPVYHVPFTLALMAWPGIAAAPDALQDNDRFDQLRAALAGTRFEADVDLLDGLAKIEVASAMNKLRKIAEGMVISELHRAQVTPSGKGLNAYGDELRRVYKLGELAEGYLHTVRNLGNLGSHHIDDELSAEDLRVMAYALAVVLDELRRLEPQPPSS